MTGVDLGTLADLVVCPRSHSPLVADGGRLVCTDSGCRLSFPVRDGIPILLVDEATELDRDDWQAVVGDQAAGHDAILEESK